MPWITIREASEILNISTRTVRKRIEEGTLPSRLENGIRLVFLGSVQELSPSCRKSALDRKSLSILFKTYEDFHTLKAWCIERLAEEQNRMHIYGPPLYPDGKSVYKDWTRSCERIEALCATVEGLTRKPFPNTDVIHSVYREMLDIQKTWVRFDQGRWNIFFDSKQKMANENIQGIMNSIRPNLKKLLFKCRTLGDSSVTGSGSEYEMDDNE